MSDGVESRRAPSRRVLITGLSTYWGGRLAQALEGFEQIEAIIGVDSREPTRELERTEFVKVSNQHSLIQRIVRAAEIDTVIDTRLVVNSVAAPRRGRPREQRDRDDEHPRRLHRRRLAGAQVHLQELDPLLRLPSRTTRPSSPSAMRRPHPPRTAIERDIVEAEQAVDDFADKQPRGHGDRAALRERARARRRHRVHADVLAAAGADGARLRPAAAVRARGRRRPRARARRRSTASRASTTSPPTGCWRCRRSIGAARQAAAAGPAAVGDRPARGAAAAARLPDPRRDGQPAALRPRGRQPPATRRPGSTTASRRARRCSGSASTCGSQPILRGACERGLPYEREVEEFLRWSPHVAARARRAEGVGRRSRAARHLKPTLAERNRIAVLADADPAPSYTLRLRCGPQASDRGRLRRRAICCLLAVGAYAWDSSKLRRDRRRRDDRRRRRRRDDRRRGPQGGRRGARRPARQDGHRRPTTGVKYQLSPEKLERRRRRRRDGRRGARGEPGRRPADPGLALRDRRRGRRRDLAADHLLQRGDRRLRRQGRRRGRPRPGRRDDRAEPGLARGRRRP